MAKTLSNDVDQNVQHPIYYGGADDPYEAIKVIEAWNLGFHLGNTVKYISRAGKRTAILLHRILKGTVLFEP